MKIKKKRRVRAGLRFQLSICPNCSKKYAPKKAGKNRGWRRAKRGANPCFVDEAFFGAYFFEQFGQMDNWKRKPDKGPKKGRENKIWRRAKRGAPCLREAGLFAAFCDDLGGNPW